MLVVTVVALLPFDDAGVVMKTVVMILTIGVVVLE